MRKLVTFAVVAMATVASPLAHSSEGVSGVECNPFPRIDGADIQAGGSLELSGLGKLAGGRVQGEYSKMEKRLLADGPDTNRTEVLMALLAYHCRRVKGLSEADHAKADQQFYEVVKALSASERKHPVNPS